MPKETKHEKNFMTADIIRREKKRVFKVKEWDTIADDKL